MTRCIAQTLRSGLHHRCLREATVGPWCTLHAKELNGALAAPKQERHVCANLRICERFLAERFDSQAEEVEP